MRMRPPRIVPKTAPMVLTPYTRPMLVERRPDTRRAQARKMGKVAPIPRMMGPRMSMQMSAVTACAAMAGRRRYSPATAGSRAFKSIGVKRTRRPMAVSSKP